MMPLSMIDFDTHKAYLGGTQLGEVWLGSDLIYKAEKILVGTEGNAFGTPTTTLHDNASAWKGGESFVQNDDGSCTFYIRVINWVNWKASFPNRADTEGYETLKFIYTIENWTAITSSNFSVIRYKTDGTSSSVSNKINGTLNQEQTITVSIAGYDSIGISINSGCGTEWVDQPDPYEDYGHNVYQIKYKVILE